MKKMLKTHSGFTLVELIVVIAILGVLAAILVPQYLQYVEKSRTAVCEQNRGEILRDYETRIATGDSTSLSAVLSEYEEKGISVCPDGNENLAANDTELKLSCAKHDSSDETSVHTIGNTGSLLDFAKGKTYVNSKDALDAYKAANGNDYVKVDSDTKAAISAALPKGTDKSVLNKTLFWRPQVVKDETGRSIVVMLGYQFLYSNKANVIYYNGSLYYHQSGNGALDEAPISSSESIEYTLSKNGRNKDSVWVKVDQ